MKKTFKLLSIVFILILTTALLVGCNSKKEEENNNNSNQELSYVSLRINPEIELLVDENGMVVTVNAVNSDGETVLYNLTLEGLTIEEAAEAFTSMSVELGFIDVNTTNASVYILVDGESVEYVKSLEEKITNKINAFFTNVGIYGQAVKEELEEFNKLAEEWHISVRDAILVERVLYLYPEMTKEEVLSLSYEEKINLIKSSSLPANLHSEYKQKVEAIKEKYEELFDLEEEIKEIEAKLQKTEELLETEIAVLQAELEVKKLQYEALLKAYELEIATVNTYLQEKVKLVEEEIKNIYNTRKQEYEQKFKEHEEEIKDKIEDIKDLIDKWQNEENNK